MRSRSRLLKLSETAATVLATSFGFATASQASSPATVKGHAGPLFASMLPSTHHPQINKPWPLTVTATLRGKPAKAAAHYQFLYGGIVVSTQSVRGNKHFMFTGHYHDKLTFPPPSLDQALTLQVVVSASGHTVDLDWAVTPVK